MLESWRPSIKWETCILLYVNDLISMFLLTRRQMEISPRYRLNLNQIFFYLLVYFFSLRQCDHLKKWNSYVAQSWGSIHGEELAYVFGMPLVGGTNHLTLNYTRAEMLLSEMVITYWTNFARTGYLYLFSNY